ncbi:hypothetical protein [Shouchella miscanthi]|uniref:hypothetical protein n=1 Tax=Shouchella miscanthi TaxID=2598861 RepID=UPI0011A409C5|nr:hypothetical protein [Shouchella miscanthi]
MSLHYWSSDTDAYKRISDDYLFYLENHIRILGMAVGVERVARRLKINERDVIHLFHEVARIKKPNQLAG